MSNAPLPTLSSPLTLPNGQVLPNRIMKSALSEALGTRDNAPDIRLTRLYQRWGGGGYGLLVTGNVMVDHRHLGEPGNVAVEDGRDLDALSRWATTAQDGGSPIWMQINHPGRQGNPVTTVGGTLAPSAVGLDIPGIPAPREATVDEIEEILDRFAATAAVAEEAGFDGVQIHAAHGYLISQFLSPLANLRTDEWGGDIAGRARFVLEVVRRVRERVSPGFAVGIKLNSADFQLGGFSEDESRAVIAMIAELPVDLLEISGGSYESPAMMGKSVSASTASREAYFLDYAVTVRDIAPHIPLAVTGGFRTRAGMDDAIASGACHVVGLGRPTAVSPDAARDVLDGRIDTLPSPSISVPVPARFSAHRSVRSLDGLLDLQWHTDQLHRMGAGLEPDPVRSVTRTLLTSMQRNGVDALKAKRRGPVGAPRNGSTSTGSTILGAAAVRTVLDDYRSWKALGPGGLPANPAGWACASVLRPFGRDGKTVPAERRSQAELVLPMRRGERPAVAPHPIPHRQIGGDAEPATRRALESVLLSYASSPTFSLSRSKFERRGDALFLSDTHAAEPWIQQAGGELAHVHSAQGSLHVVAHPDDADAIVEAGWGERHPLAGRRLLGLPYSYLFLYAPRDDEDLQVIVDIVRRVIGRASHGGNQT